MIRVAGLAAIAALVVLPGSWRLRPLRALAILWSAIAVLAALQLVPLPPSVWTSLPGRAAFAEVAQAVGVTQPWRPLALVPERGWNALFALIPPSAILLLQARSDQRQSILLGAWALIASGSAVVTLTQWSLGPEMVQLYSSAQGRAGAGLFANRNHQALLLACGLLLLTGWATMSGPRRVVRAVAAPCAGLFLLLMVPAAGSRAGLLLAGVAAILAAVVAFPELRRRSGKRARALLIAGVAAAFAAALLIGRTTAMARLLDEGLGDPIRLTAARVTIQMIGIFFPAGTGFGSFDHVYRMYEPLDALQPVYMNQAHNEILQLLLEGGLPGALLLAGAAVLYLVGLVRVWKARASDRVLRGRLGAALLALVLLASLVDYPARTPIFMALAMQAACWMALASARAEPENRALYP